MLLAAWCSNLQLTWPVMMWWYSLWFQLNPSVSSFQRRFVSEIKRCEEMERILGKRERESRAPAGVVSWAYTCMIYHQGQLSSSGPSESWIQTACSDTPPVIIIIITMKQTVSIFCGQVTFWGRCRRPTSPCQRRRRARSLLHPDKSLRSW